MFGNRRQHHEQLFAECAQTILLRHGHAAGGPRNNPSQSKTPKTTIGFVSRDPVSGKSGEPNGSWSHATGYWLRFSRGSSACPACGETIAGASPAPVSDENLPRRKPAMLLLTAEPSLAARSIIELPVEVEPIAPEIQALSQWIDARRAEIAALRESERRQARSRRVYRARLRKLVVVHQREAVRADALQARLDALEARAVDELVEDEDDPAETFVLTRSLAAAEDEIEHLRARLLGARERSRFPRRCQSNGESNLTTFSASSTSPVRRVTPARQKGRIVSTQAVVSWIWDGP